MNALWTTRMCAYKHSSQCVYSARELIRLKVARKNILLERYKKEIKVIHFDTVKNIQDILLLEARAAKVFWKEFASLLPKECGFIHRAAGGQDVVNKLLDIGYHHLTVIVKKIIIDLGVQPDLALLHVARNADSAPLAYDLVEIFRADIVDVEVLRCLRLKKKHLATFDPKEIANFLHEINERLERKYYLEDFKQCHTYRYYMELQILKFISAVNHKQVFSPIYLPTRHDMRCS